MTKLPPLSKLWRMGKNLIIYYLFRFWVEKFLLLTIKLRIPLGFLNVFSWYAEKQRIKKVLDKSKINIVIDVGANAGQFAKELRRLGYKGWIVSFEPIPRVFEKLAKDFANDKKWMGYNYALGANEESKTLNISNATEYSSLLNFNNEGYKPESLSPRGGQLNERVEIQIKLLNSFKDKIFEIEKEPNIFLKVDTQGFDLEVLKGAGDILSSVSLIKTEVSLIPIYKDMPNFQQTLDYIERIGFKILDLHVVTRVEELGYVLEYDCIAGKL